MAIGRLNIGLTGVQPGGLAKIVPTSVAVGSGSGSSDSNGTVTFSAASSVSLNNIFSSTYQNYIVKWNLTGAGITELHLRLRTTSDDSGNNYYGNKTTMTFTSSTVTGNNYNADSKINFGEANTEKNAGFANVMSPNESGRTLILVQSFGNDRWNPGGWETGVATQYTGITIIGGTQNITGTVRVYGYN